MSQDEHELLLAVRQLLKRVDRKLDRIDEGLKIVAQTQGRLSERVAEVEKEISDAIESAIVVGRSA